MTGAGSGSGLGLGAGSGADAGGSGTGVGSGVALPPDAGSAVSTLADGSEGGGAPPLVKVSESDGPESASAGVVGVAPGVAEASGAGEDSPPAGGAPDGAVSAAGLPTMGAWCVASLGVAPPDPWMFFE